MTRSGSTACAPPSSRTRPTTTSVGPAAWGWAGRTHRICSTRDGATMTTVQIDPTTGPPRQEGSDMSTALVSAHGVALRYGGIRALDGVDLDLAPGRIVGLLGPNGCGKTTLLKILAGVLQGYDGQVSIAGHAPGPESKALVSYLPDSGSLPGGSTVEACLGMYRDFFADF